MEDCQKLCAQRGWDVVDEYVDNNISAAKPGKSRPEHDRLLADIRAGKLDAVVVWDVDRLYRQPRELEPFVDACEAAGLKTLGSVGGDIDLNDESALMLLRFKVAMAAAEVAKIRKRIVRQKQERAEKGLFNGGIRPFGFEADGVTQNATECVLIREAADRILEGSSLQSIVRDWNARGVLTSTGGRWSSTSLRRMIMSPRVAGLRQYQGSPLGKAAWDPILAVPVWEQVKAIFENPERRTPALHTGRVFPLRGVLFCGNCGKALGAMSRGKDLHREYGCKKQDTKGGVIGCGKVFVRADIAEAWIQMRLVPWADNPRMRNILSQDTAEQALEIKQLVADQASDAAVLEELDVSRWQQGEIPHAVYISQRSALEGRMAERTQKLGTMRGQSVLDKYEGQVAERWDELEREEQREILLALVERVEVDPVGKGAQLERTPRRFRFIWRTTEMLDPGDAVDEYGNVYSVEIDQMV